MSRVAYNLTHVTLTNKLCASIGGSDYMDDMFVKLGLLIQMFNHPRLPTSRVGERGGGVLSTHSSIIMCYINALIFMAA